MKNVFLFSILFFLSTASTFAQQCNCAESFDWMVNTFKTNDAGFQYVIDKKGMDEYIKHTDFYRHKALNATSTNDCLTLMNNWLFFFRKGHIGAYLKPELLQKTQSGPLSEHSKDSIRTLYRNEETVDFSDAQFRELLKKNTGKLNAIEGIWTSNTYSIGITRSPEKKNQFVAFIIKADSVYWIPKQKKAEFTLNSDSSYAMVYSMRDHSKKSETARLVGQSGNLLLIMNTLWTKVYPDTANSNYCRRIALKMRQNIGSFITQDDSRVSVDSIYTPSAFPVKVAIICNQYNGSTDEAFLLKAKQSSKVKVFGRPTIGVLDISNIRKVDFPNGQIQLIYSMTASLALPAFSIDGVGIQPDYFIDDTIPEEDWIQFVQSTIEH